MAQDFCRQVNDDDDDDYDDDDDDDDDDDEGDTMLRDKRSVSRK